MDLQLRFWKHREIQSETVTACAEATGSPSMEVPINLSNAACWRQVDDERSAKN
jgi:hypothetical protein